MSLILQCKSNCRCGQVHDILTEEWGDVIGPSGNFSKLKQYCCSTTPCERETEYPDTINCKNGIVKSITEHCGVNECPTARVVSSSALSINKGKFQCYENRQADYFFSNVHLNFTMTDEVFSRTFCGSDKGVKICNSAYSKSKNEFQQCYNVQFYRGSR